MSIALMKCGILSLGDHLPNPHSGNYEESQAERHQLWVELGVQGEKLGFDALWLGEHHFNDYILSMPQMVLAAVAVRTQRIRLGTAVTLLAHHDPVLLAEQFATLDLLSNGRAEIGFSTGITRETYRLFGQNEDDALAIQEENIELLKQLWSQDMVKWSGRFRAPFDGGRLEPRTYTGRPIPICVGTASKDRIIKLAAEGQKLMLPTIFGRFETFRGVAALYRSTYLEAGHDPAHMEITAPCYIHVRDDGRDAREYWKPYLANYRSFVQRLAENQKLNLRIAPVFERQTKMADHQGFWRDSDIVGTPDEVISQIRLRDEAIGGIDTLMCYFDCGGLPAAEVIETMTVFAEKVMPHLG